jgi:uncharacterized surface protein with fasciclin (FAS1) repeats
MMKLNLLNMKLFGKQTTLIVIALGILGTTLFSSCKKDDPTPAAKNIAEIVASDANFSLLNQAVTKAGLVSALSSGSLTVFAPDNAAFAASGITSATITSLTVAQVADILTYHVIGSKIMSTGVPASDTVKTLQGKNLYASKNTNGVFVNGIKVKTADVSASNGIIHVISAVMTPPTQTIAEIASGNANLSLLLAAVSRAGLAGAVSSAGKYTVFAPTNDAFIAAGFPDAATIDAAPVTAVAAIVKAHLFGTSVFASDLIQGQIVGTLQTGTSLVVGTTPPSVKITTSANPASNILAPTGVNIVATNGVIHLIDRVIL